MSSWVVGVDLGGTKIEMGLVDPQNQIVARYRVPTADEEGPQAVVERIAEGVAELATAVPGNNQIAALGICTPGPVDHAAGMVLDPPNVKGLHNIPLRQLLADRLQMPVGLEHDAKAAGLGEFYYGAGQEARSMVFVVVGTGVGAAIIMDGQLYRGEHNYAGEIGHTTLDLHGPVCSCGNRGCVETFMSGPWLSRHYQDKSRETVVKVTGEQVAQLAGEDDPIAAQVMAGAGEALGTAVATMAMLYNIDLYVIGGSVAKAGDLFIIPANQAVPHHAHQSVAANVRILATQLGTDGPILGCGWLARQAANL